MPYRNPGDYLTSKNRYAQMLMNSPNYNTGTTTGGLAHLLQQGLSGFMMGQDARDRRLATQALSEAAQEGTGTPWVNPDTGEVSQHPALAAAQQKLGALDPGNEYAGRNLQALLMSRVGQEQETARSRSEQEREAIASQRRRTESLEDYRKRLVIQQEFEPASETFKTVQDPFGRGGVGQESSISGQITGYRGPEAEKTRPTAMSGAGILIYTDDGTPVVKGAKSAQDRFMELLAPPGELGGGSGADILGGRLPLTGGQGVDELIGQSGGDILTGPKPQPTVRDIFFKLPPEVQTGIKMSKDPMKAFSAYLLKSKGLDIQFNDDGTIKSINQGGMGGSSWARKQTGTIQEKLFNSREGLARIANIEQSFRPEFQEIGTRLNAAWSAIKESFGATLDPADKAELQDYAVYKMGAIENINLYIKEITGAQMSEAEAVRLRQGQPDPGDSWYNGDSPSEFEGKLKAQTRQLRTASARYVYALKNDWDVDPEKLETTLPLTKVEDLIEERGAALERQLRGRRPDLSDSAIEGFVIQSLNAEFGIGQ